MMKSSARRALGVALGLAAGALAWASRARAAEARAGEGQTSAVVAPHEIDVPPAEPRDLARLQSKLAGVVGWEFTAPLGSVRSFSANVSPLGLELQLRYWALQQLSISLGGDWVWFGDVRPRTTYQLDHATVRATAYDSLVSSTLRLGAQYYLLDEGLALPYVGPHLGLGWTRYRSETADLELSEDEFSFVYGAEAGVLLPMAGSAPLFLFQVRYAAQPGSEFRNLVSNVQTLTFTAAVGF
ncbi:MAG TPA: hypothetical protein VFS67_15665 [Polyangiaceae bacterium]|jgi:hypothetical protein|nr:hypothetical protein [Polyangiaceae bacterium]